MPPVVITGWQFMLTLSLGGEAFSKAPMTMFVTIGMPLLRQALALGRVLCIGM